MLRIVGSPRVPPGASGERRPRRSPEPARRRRDPERTRARILDAAVEEFGEYGFAGARVSRIAARAGVNQQLIAYYFGGKAGLYQALQRRWEQTSAELGGTGLPLEAVVANFLRAGRANRSWARLMAWQGLTDEGADQPGGVEQTAFLQAMVADLERRREAGELAADLDPAHAMLALFAAASAPTVLPHIVRSICGADPDSDAFIDGYAEQLARIVRHLQGGAAPGRVAERRREPGPA